MSIEKGFEIIDQIYEESYREEAKIQFVAFNDYNDMDSINQLLSKGSEFYNNVIDIVHEIRG